MYESELVWNFSNEFRSARGPGFPLYFTVYYLSCSITLDSSKKVITEPIMSRVCYATPEKTLTLQSRVLLPASRQPLSWGFFHGTDFTQGCYLQVYG